MMICNDNLTMFESLKAVAIARLTKILTQKITNANKNPPEKINENL